MPEHVLAALRVAASTMEFREMEIPEISADAALLKVESTSRTGRSKRLWDRSFTEVKKC